MKGYVSATEFWIIFLNLKCEGGLPVSRTAGGGADHVPANTVGFSCHLLNVMPDPHCVSHRLALTSKILTTMSFSAQKYSSSLDETLVLAVSSNHNNTDEKAVD